MNPMVSLYELAFVEFISLPLRHRYAWAVDVCLTTAEEAETPSCQCPAVTSTG